MIKILLITFKKNYLNINIINIINVINILSLFINLLVSKNDLRNIER